MITLTPEIPNESLYWRNDTRVWQYCRQYTYITQAQHDGWKERIATDPTIKMFGVQWRVDGEISLEVGVCGLTSIDRVNQKAEFSLYIAPEHQRKGYGEQALKILIKHGFEDHNLNRIWGETYDGNPAAKMFEKLGMQKEGTLRQAYFRRGKFIDSHIYSILRGA